VAAFPYIEMRLLCEYHYILKTEHIATQDCTATKSWFLFTGPVC
jgi:hypothetical protein